ncbi:MAG: hypothetical protein IJO31_08615 [Oscillospiraceae bacterium]|nr:hypothetical protein [Oscillospiraceae bacterium]
MQQTVYPDTPTSEGMKNALLRAQQLAKLRWTPVKPLPAIVSTGIPDVSPYHIFLPAYKPQVGANYAAVGFTNEKYVGTNVSIETFMTALANPNSVLYTRTQHGKSKLASAYYGTVCSEFASFVLGLPFHIDCPQFPNMKEFQHIDSGVLEDLQLCDLLNEAKTHTAVVTGIDRDSSGKVVRITVTESTPPRVQVTEFLPEEFIHWWFDRGYQVLRYKKLHTVPYTPNPWVPLVGDPELPAPVPNPVILPDFGDKANYRLPECVTFSVFDASYTEVAVTQNGKTVVSMPVSSEGTAVFQPDTPGCYEAFAIGDGQKSKIVEFCVTEAAVTTDRTQYTQGEAVHLTFTCALGDTLVGFMVKTADHAKYLGVLRSDDGILADTVTLPAGDYYIIAHYRNRYGVYSATPSPVFHITGE